MSLRVLSLLAATALVGSPALAQPAASSAPPAKAAGKDGKTVDEVTVTGASQSGFRSSIDRRSYGVANDLAATTGSISDALKNIPSVAVDAQGTVSLRGDTNVTIMIDGKPSAMFRGDSAAQALQSMPADSIERVEIITNPSAEFSPEGAAGVINLVTKKIRKPGKSGSMRLNAGTGGRLNGGGSASYNANRLTLTADVGARHEPQDASGRFTQTLFDGQGHKTGANTTRQDNTGKFDLWNGRFGADYDVDPKTRLSGEARYNHFKVDRRQAQVFAGLDAAGNPNLDFTSRAPADSSRGTGAVQATLKHSFSGEDHTLALNVSRERTLERVDQSFDEFITVPSAAEVYSHLRVRNLLTLTEAKADYVKPLPDDAKLKTGYDLRVDDNHYDDVGLRGASAATAGPDANQTNRFLYKQTINAGYLTYERPFGDWTVLAGLRLEDVELDLDQLTQTIAHDSNKFNAYPSLHLAYKATDDQQITLSYSRRVQRPNAQALNPFRVQNDPLNFSAGNPNLKPQVTDSFETAYQYKSGQTYYLATIYYRHNQHGPTSVLTPLPGGAVLNTRENLTSSQAAGLELVANGHLTKTLSYNLSSNLYWNEIDAAGQGLEQIIGAQGRRSALELGGRGSVTWQATPKDSLQLNVQANAKQLVPQGYNAPNQLVFLGYRHKFSDALTAVVTAQDVLHTFTFHGISDTPLIQQSYHFRPDIRAVFVGFTWSFSGGSAKPPRDPGFDFGGGAGGGPPS